MKKIFSLLVCLFACFLVVGCSFIEDIVGEDDDDDGNKYVWEYGLISSNEKVSIYSYYTFEEIKSARDTLRERTKSYNYHSPSNISETWFRNYLQSTTDMTASEIEADISYLNKHGNIILYFYYKGNTIWYYLEKR